MNEFMAHVIRYFPEIVIFSFIMGGIVGYMVYGYCDAPFKNEFNEIEGELVQCRKNAYIIALQYGWRAQLQFLLQHGTEIHIIQDNVNWSIVADEITPQVYWLKCTDAYSEFFGVAHNLNDALKENLVHKIEIRAIVANLMKQAGKDL